MRGGWFARHDLTPKEQAALDALERGRNPAQPDTHGRVAKMARVPFDVTGVLPFPMRDPHANGVVPGHAIPRERLELQREQEPYRLYTVEELGNWPPVRWLIDDYLAVGELSVLYGAGGTYKSFLAL